MQWARIVRKEVKPESPRSPGSFSVMVISHSGLQVAGGGAMRPQDKHTVIDGALACCALIELEPLTISHFVCSLRDLASLKWLFVAAVFCRTAVIVRRGRGRDSKRT